MQGIDKDVENYVRYFSLPEGGLWDFSDDGDAICFETNSISADAFLSFLSDVAGSEDVDYWLIVFSGHGGSGPNKVDVLEICPEQRDVISDCSVKEIRQAIGRNTRVVLITDCCRGPIPAYEQVVKYQRVCLLPQRLKVNSTHMTEENSMTISS